MANKHSNPASLYSDIATAIREKTGNVETIVADNFPDAIAAISAGNDRVWIECGTAKSESSNGSLCARARILDTKHLDTLLGCCILFTDEAGTPSGTYALIYAAGPGYIGVSMPFTCVDGTVTISDDGMINWTSDQIQLVPSKEIAHYIIYGVYQ